MRTLSQYLAVLTLETMRSEADALADWLRSTLATEPVQIERVDRQNVWIELYLPSAVEAMLVARAIRNRRGVLGVNVGSLAARDWRSFWKRHFHPFAAGRKLWICPSWSRKATPRGRGRVIINPGLSFGTGEHFTTRFCLEALDSLSHPRPPTSVLDVGSGSGILALAAARLGAGRVVGIDNDPQAVEQARANAVLNRFGRRVEFRVADITQGPPPGRYDVVCANLFALMLVDRAAVLLRLAKRHLVLSGIREQETDLVADAFLSAGGRETVRDGDGEWSGLVFEAGRD